MPHATNLISLIAAAFVTALVLGYLATRIKLPPLVGYLLAGMAIGPFTPGFVGDSGLAQQLSEIGVMLLMFGVGLHFSMGTLWEARRIALPGAVVQIAVATAVGAAAASFWGWNLSAGLVFGLCLSVASTVVLLRALEQRNDLNTDNGRIAVGWLIVEDLAMILALVFLPALAAGGAGPGGEGGNAQLWTTLGITALKVAAFVAVMLVGGRRVVPWVLHKVARTGSRELFTLAVLAIALGVAYGSAVLFEVSFALGAFFAGVVLAESDLSHQAAEQSLPLQDAFAVLFFVSVGMLFDPTVLVEQPLALLSVLFIVIIVKSIAAFAIVMAFGYPVRTALTISASLAQIGEFSFILAGLGVSLQLLPPDARNLVLAGSLLSIALNPLVFATIGPAERVLMPLFARRRAPAAPTGAALLRDHAVIVGYGRVGSVIGDALAARGLAFVVVERRARVVDEHVKERGIPVVVGDASADGVLDAAGIAHARLLVVASPDGFYARRVLELARKVNPRIATVVRTHSAAEREYLAKQGVDHAVMGEHELALAMSGYALEVLDKGR